MNASEVRQKYLDFMKSKGHVQIQPAPLVLENDPTTLFTGSGMQPLLPYLLGKPHKEGKRLTDSQPCLRLQDIDDVGDPRHTTVFEMLGNWSLGDYFKEEQIRNFFTFLTKEIGLDPQKIYVTCFIGNKEYGIPRDDEAAAIWQKVFAEVGIKADIAEIDTAEMVTSAASKVMSVSSSITTKKTGGLAVAALRLRRLATRAVQTRKYFMILVKSIKTKPSTEKLIQLPTALVLWKLAIRSSCNTAA